MISLLCRLFRLRLVLVNAVSAVGGYLLFPAEPRPGEVAALFAALFLLVSGASALNQVQERDSDRLMERTARRPLPLGEISPPAASAVGALCSAGALLSLIYNGGASPALLGLLGLVWYLAIYTPLKRRTPFALPVGALCGALPPVIGWCFAGGSAADFRIALLAALWYLWQVPHFWLLQGRHRLDYLSSPFTLLHSGSETLRSLLFCVWTTALVAVLLLFTLFRLLPPSVAGGCALLCTLPLVELARSSRAPRTSTAFSLFPVLFTIGLYLAR